MGRDGMNMLRDASADSTLSLDGIYEISKVLGSALDLDRALHDVLGILSSHLDMRHGAVALQHPETHELEIIAVAGMSLSLARSGALNFPFAAVQKVISSAVPMVAPDAAAEPLLADYLARRQPGNENGPASFLCVPIKTTGSPLGALSVERDWKDGVRGAFAHDLRILAMVATLIGQTTSLHRKVAAERERLMKQMTQTQTRPYVEIKPLTPAHETEDVIGKSEAMAKVLAQTQQAAKTKATILLRGESGTGKELIARAAHMLSPRSHKPFIKVNCAALAENVLESELFGHERGAFTGAIAERKGRFELASGGTLFLDEIGEISAPFQAKLLRVLQEGEFERVGGTKTHKVDVRLVAATNRNLEEAVAKGDFRADLYYRLNVVPIFLPPLRERQGDIPLLATYFLKRFNEENGRATSLSPQALSALQRCIFPGNVRELENCVTRVATMCKGDVITEMDLSCRKGACLSSILWNSRPVRPPNAETASDPLSTADASDERDRLIEAMERCGWVQAKAARLLNLTPRQVAYALKKHGIEIEKI